MVLLIGFVVFTGGPILFSIVISFCEYDILSPARFVGLDNYAWAFTKDALFWKSVWNTLYMVIGIPLGMALSLGIALILLAGGEIVRGANDLRHAETFRD